MHHAKLQLQNKFLTTMLLLLLIILTIIIYTIKKGVESVADDLQVQVVNKLKPISNYALQLDETTGITNKSQLIYTKYTIYTY